MLNPIVSIINNKGGVGKTTITINLAHALAKAGKRVLVIDMDAQCNATSVLYPSDTPPTCSVYEVLSDDWAGDLRECISATKYKGLFLLPNVEETAGLEWDLIQQLPGSATRLRQRLRDAVKSDFDHILIDNPPSLGLFVSVSLHASDAAIVPVLGGDSFSVDGLIKAVGFIQGIRENGNPNLQFLRLLINGVDNRESIAQFIRDQIELRLGKEWIFRSSLPQRTDIKQAIAAREPILAHKASSSGAKAYRSLAQEYLKVVEEA